MKHDIVIDAGEETEIMLMRSAVFEQAREIEAAKNTISKQQKILLALSGVKSDIDSFKYAVNMCGRLGAGLDILYRQDKSSVSLEQFQYELEKQKISYRLIKRNGCLIKDIQTYTDSNKNILFVVLEVPGELNINSRKFNKVFPGPFRKLKCPLVTVSKHLPA